jgi:hypothetical protein
MKTLIFLLILSAYAEENIEPDRPLFGKKKADFLEEMKEKDEPDQEDIACVQMATNRNALNRCKMEMKNTKKEEKKNPENEESDLDE